MPEIYQNTVDLVKDLAKNPIVELVVGFALVEKLQDNGVLGNWQGNLVEATIGGLIVAQQIAPIVPDLIKGGESLLGVLGGAAALIPK